MVTFTKRLTYKPTFKRYSIITLLHTKSLIKPKNQWIYAKNAFFAQLSLVQREHVNQNCMEIPREQFFSLAWLLAYVKLASLVSCVVNKPGVFLLNYNRPVMPVTTSYRSMYVKHHVKNEWKFSYFHTLFSLFSHTFYMHFTHIFHMHVKFCMVKYMWKGCEVMSTLSHIFSHTLHVGFHMGFHMYLILFELQNIENFTC